MTPLNREALIEAMAAGRAFEFLPFYGHTARPDGALSNACFSQWWPAAFTHEGVRYDTAEQFMMAEKARLFGDGEMLTAILREPDPAKVKKLGRRVQRFDASAWERHRFEAVTRGNVSKFSSSAALETFLLATGDAVLVEAAPRDRIWGVGLGRTNPRISKPAEWNGQNLLGFALMRAREVLRSRRA